MSDPKTEKRSDVFWVPGEAIILTAEGRWLSNGQEITHPGTVDGFFRNIRRDDEGYFIKIGYEAKRVTVEGTPYFAPRIEGGFETGFVLELSDGSKEPLAAETLRFESEGVLICDIKNGAEQARILRPAYNELMGALEHDAQGYFLMIAQRRITLSGEKGL